MGFFSNILESAKTAQAPASVVGIDIGSSAIKVVELEDRNGVLTLLTYGEIQLGPYGEQPLGSGVAIEPNKQQEALIDVIRESAVKASSAVFAMPLSASFISTSTFRADPDTDLTAQVRVEARKIIPASLSEVTLDWVELDTTESNSDSRQVLIAAIQNIAIERLNILMQFVGFGNAPTEIECFSTGRMIPKTGHQVVIDFGASTVKMYIFNNGVLQRMYRVNAGGADVTAKLAQVLESDFEAAEQLKLQMTRSDNEYAALSAAYGQVYSRPLREIRQVMQQYQSNHDITFDVIHVCGGASIFSGLDALVGDTVGISTSSVAPFSHVAYPAFMEDAMVEIGASFVSALGAAMRHFE